jgi:hypothetical protein
LPEGSNFTIKIASKPSDLVIVKLPRVNVFPLNGPAITIFPDASVATAPELLPTPGPVAAFAQRTLPEGTVFYNEGARCSKE